MERRLSRLMAQHLGNGLFLSRKISVVLVNNNNKFINHYQASRWLDASKILFYGLALKVWILTKSTDQDCPV